MADYNINAVTRRVVFTGSAGVGPYSFTFEVLDQNDLAVYFNTTKLTLTTDYTVSIAANGTGSVTIVVGTNVPTTPDADDTIIIVGARDIERTTDFVTAGDLRASALNEQLDGLTIFDQQIAEEQKRTLQAPVYDPAHVDDGGTLDMTLPAKAARAGKYLQFNSTTGNPEAGPDSTDVTALADIATDIATLADIEDGTDATDAIQTVAGISANVTTVAGIASNVTTVAGNTSNINAVAADATDIGTVATNIASVNTVAGNISEVIAVANDLNEAVSEVETVANDLNEAVSEIETVAASISNVDAVGTNIANVNTVAGNNSNVTTVAGISANVTTVAGISGNVTTVAGISADVTTVAADGSDIGTVATNIANVNSVAGNATNINNVAGNATNINTVAGISADVTTVAGDSADIQAVAADATDIGTVSTNIANVNTVAGSIANVNITAANITGVNSFAERYRVGATDPTTSLDEGDLFFNTTDNAYKFYDGSAWQTVNVSGIGSVLDDATPQLGGNLDVNGNDITGTGDINITGTVTADGIESTCAAGDGNLALQAYHPTSTSARDIAKFQSNVGGTQVDQMVIGCDGNVDINGTITSDGLTVAQSNPVITITDTDGSTTTTLKTLGSNTELSNTTGGNLRFRTSASELERIRVSPDGDISFYDSTGVTQGLFWDASTQRLGLGTTSPSVALHVKGANNPIISQSTSTGGGPNSLKFIDSASTDLGYVGYGAANKSLYLVNFSADPIIFYNSSEKMRIDSVGNVGIGTSSPNRLLDIKSNVPAMRLTDTTTSGLYHEILGDGDSLSIEADDGNVGSSSSINFKVGGTEHMTINSSGNVGIGTDSPDSSTPLHVAESSASLGANPTASAFLVERAGNVGMTLGTANTGLVSIFMGDTDSLTVGRVQYDNSGDSLQFWANSLERMRIDSSGNVGIGTSSPIAQSALTVGGGQGSLSVNGSDGNFSAGGQRAFMDLASGKARIGGTGGGGAGTTLGLYVGTGTEAINVTAAGLVGIGKTATTALDVNGTVTATVFVGDGSGLTGVVGSTAAGDVGTYGLFYIYNNNTARSFGYVQAGSGLYPVSVSGSTQTSTQAGSWRVMGKINSGGVQDRSTVFVRIS